MSHIIAGIPFLIDAALVVLYFFPKAQWWLLAQGEKRFNK